MRLRVQATSTSVARTIALLLVASLYAPAQTQQPAATSDTKESAKPGEITGRVINESGQPLPNANVWIRVAGSPGRVQSTATDRDGAFKFTGLPPVPYLLGATMPAYTAAPREPDNPQPSQYRVGDSVTFVLMKGGVITGKVTTTNGDPVVAVGVSVQMVRDHNGRRLTSGGMVRQIPTDDRGIYRFYGLPTGTYTVMAGGSQDYSRSGVNAFESDIPTYAPSSTRETAAEISVRSGEETTDVDIRYRGEPGRTISGIATGPHLADAGFAVILTATGEGGSQWDSSDYTQPGSQDFVFMGLGDGDYYLTAQSHLQGGEVVISDSKLVSVRGADVAGIELTTQPLGSIAGRVVLEDSKRSECNDKTPPVLAEMSVSAWHRENEAAKKQPRFIWNFGAPVAPDAQGNVTLKNLAPGQYYIVARSVPKSWYVQSISLAPTVGKTGKPVDAARTWTNVKGGDKLSGLTITLAPGAASLRGRLASGEGETPQGRYLVYLVPAEKEKADEILRFYGAAVSSDGKIAFDSLAPGRYWVLAQPVIEEAPSPLTKLRVPDETEMRLKLRRDAEAAKTEIELKPCQNVVDFQVPVGGN